MAVGRPLAGDRQCPPAQEDAFAVGLHFTSECDAWPSPNY